jgi:hypothetical protein
MSSFTANAGRVRFALLPAVLFAWAVPCRALTVEEPLTVDYVRTHPAEWSVKVAKEDGGLVKFTVVRNLAEPRYLVAHLAVHHGGKLIATSDSPAFGKKQGNTFYFSLAEEDLADSKFDLSESVFNDFGDNAVPEPGTIIHQFPLKEFFLAASEKPARAESPTGLTEHPKTVETPKQVVSEKPVDERLNCLVEKVLKAHGGEAKLGGIKAFTLKFRDAKPAGKAGTTEYFVQLPNEFRLENGTERDAAKDIHIILGPDGVRNWKKQADGKITEVHYLGLEAPPEYWLDYVKFLGPRRVLRLKDPDYQLKLLDEIKIDDRPAVGIELTTSAPQFKISLKVYFDKESGLLVEEENVLQKSETIFSDYKQIDGVMVPSLTRESHDIVLGRSIARMSNKQELVEFKVLEKLDAKLFEQP